MAPARNPHGNTSPPQRRLSISLRALKGGYEVVAECERELTSVMVLNGGDSLPMPDPGELAKSPLARAVAVEHLDRCGACKRWARKSA